MTLFKNFVNLKPQTSNLKPQTSNLKPLLYLLVLGIVFTNCEKDDNYTEDGNTALQPKDKGYTVKKVTLNEVKANSIIKRSLDKIENQFDFNKLNTSKKSKNIGNTNTSAAVSNDPINSKDNTFTILTDEILQVSTDSTDVYTFRIEIPTKPESDFENFVIHKNSNGSIAYYIYSYKNYSDDFTALNVSRKKVNEDQINISDFDDYLPSVMKYDATNECWISITKEGNDIVIDISDCGDKGGTGGSGGTAGGGSVSNNHAFTLYGQNGNAVGYPNFPYTFGNWAIVGVTNDGRSYRLHRPLLDENGYPIGTLHQVTIADITNGSSTDFDLGTYDPFSNSTNTWSNTDPLHGGNTGGGGTSPSNNTSSTDGTNINDGDVIAVLAPTPLEREINTFFNNISDEQKECMVFGWNQLKTDITNFFEANQTITTPSRDGTVYDGALIDSSLKDFAHAAIDAHCAGGKVDFDDKVILDSTFVANEKLKCVYDKITNDNNPLFKNTVGVFIDDPEFNLTFQVGNCSSTDDQCTDRNDPYNIVITFEDVNVSPVEMAQAILHEAIHAEMARYIEQDASGVDVNDRPRIFQLYQHYKGLYENKDINHLYMIEKYLDPLTSALREFDNYNYPLDYYKSFAWDGLRDMDPNNILNLPINSTYAGYRTIVIQNNTVCN